MWCKYCTLFHVFVLCFMQYNFDVLLFSYMRSFCVFFITVTCITYVTCFSVPYAVNYSASYAVNTVNCGRFLCIVSSIMLVICNLIASYCFMLLFHVYHILCFMYLFRVVLFVHLFCVL